jgi:hypothetical protein
MFKTKYASKLVHLDNGCILWAGAVWSSGYGAVLHEGKMQGAHRVSFMHHTKEPIPAGMWVLHKCDTPRCVNPEHLFLGTRQDNIDDMNAKGRGVYVKGADVASAKLTEQQAYRILDYSAQGKSPSTIAKLFGVHPRTVRDVLNKKTWKHLARKDKI